MEKILLITSSGGGGLLQSAIAIEQDERKKDPNVFILKKDLLMEWTGGLIGLFGRFFYNWTQRAGKVTLTNIFVNLNMYAEYLFFPIVFFAVLINLFKFKIDRVIDNQPMSTSAIIKAIRVYCHFTKKDIILEKVLVDLPTKEYGQLFKAFKKLSSKDRSKIKLITIEPLLDKEKSNEQFWQKYCNFSEKQIVYKRYIIRESFKAFQNKPFPTSNFDILIHTNKERDIIERCASFGTISMKEKEEGLKFTIGPNDKLFIILLGSQPSSNAIFRYTKEFISAIVPNDTKYDLFIFADKFNSKNNLFSKILQLIESTPNYPSNLSIIPMSFQKDDVIAPLFFRSNLTITRSGGHTIMELMAVARNERWIHSETKDSSTFEHLLKGIPCWEKGNAEYFCKKNNADIVTPDILRAKLKEKAVL